MGTWFKGLAVSCSLVALTGCVMDSGEGDEAPLDEEIREVEQRETMACPAPFGGQISSVVYDKELVITDLNVVNDACRTVWNPSNPPCSTLTSNSKWTFWYLMTQMAGANNVSRFVLKWLESFEEQQVVNGQLQSSRSKIRSLVIDPWRVKSGCLPGLKYDAPSGACNLNPGFAPFRLSAIVNRADLRGGGPYGSDSGEGRFVFNFVNLSSNAPDGKPAKLQANVIFEYKLPVATWSMMTWGQKWRALGSFSAFDTNYRAALQAITDKFSLAGALPGAPNNGLAISQVRTNDFDFDPNAANRVWSLREFKLGCLPGQACGVNDKFLVPAPVAQTPANSFNGTATLETYIDANAPAILAGSHAVPDTFGGVPFRGAESKSKPFIAGPFVWMTPGYDPFTTDVDTRRLFAFSTCNGCHYAETETTNVHIAPRNFSAAAAVSEFVMSPKSVLIDPSTSQFDYDEPYRRKCELLRLAAGFLTPISTTAGRPH